MKICLFEGLAHIEILFPTFENYLRLGANLFKYDDFCKLISDSTCLHCNPLYKKISLLRTFDKNNDGLIDFREFLTALSIMSRGSFESKLEWAFDLYDQDKDGLVTKAEMLEIIDVSKQYVASFF